MAYACGFYTAFACVLTYPLVWHLSTAVPHDLGDPLMSTTLLWWNAHTTPLTARWWQGVAFYPAGGTLAFSDHRLGESLIATPLQWVGAEPATAYNITLLATFPLCAIAAHWLALTLTRRHGASLLCGLAYGFCPYRIAHMQHLELLAAAGMPAALAALHRYKETGATRWLAWFAVALAAQGLCTSYYLLFFTVLLAMWVFWFVGWRDVRGVASIAVASAAAAVFLLPIIIGYGRIHSSYGLQRNFNEIQQLSADVTSFAVASPLIALWGWTSRPAHPEGALFPGLTVALLAVGGVAHAATRTRFTRRNGLNPWTLSLIVSAGACLAVALAGWFARSPWRVEFAGIRLSSDAPFKAFSLALGLSACSLATSARVRAALRRRSPLAFYALATAILVLCSLGPKPTLNGHQILYEPIYAWLMRLPPFAAVRAPARFAMLIMLTLSVTGALVLARMRLATTRRRIVVALLACGMIADVWVRQMPLFTLPESWPASRAAGFDAVLELPLGDAFGDAAAMFRAIAHGHRVANGISGFEPPHYFTLKTALAERDPAALDGFPTGERLLIVVDKLGDPQRSWTNYLQSLPRVTPVAEDDRWGFFAAETPSQSSVCHAPTVPIVAVSTDGPPPDLGVLTDRNPASWWTTSHAQQTGDALVLDLGKTVRPCAVTVSVGQFGASYPRKLAVDASLTGDAWTTVAEERTAGLTIRGALGDPKAVSMVIPLSPSAGRFVRLRVQEPHPTIPWMVTDVGVRAVGAEE